MKKIGVLILAMSLCVLLTSCGDTQKTQVPGLIAPVNADIAVYRLTRGDVEQIEFYHGEVSTAAKEHYYEISGKVKTVFVGIGSHVNEGDILVELDTEDAAERIEKADRELSANAGDLAYEEELYELKKRQLDDREKTLYRKLDLFDIETERELLDMNMRHTREEYALKNEAAEKQKRKYETEIASRYLTAQCGGTVTGVWCRPGETVNEYEIAVSIARDDVKIVTTPTGVNESSTSKAADIYALVNGRRYPLARREFDYDSYVATAAAGGTYRTEFDILENAEELCLGDYALITIVRTRRENVLYIPSTILYSDNGSYVYIQHEDGSRERRNVETGLRTDQYAEITGGLEEGEVLYVAG